MFKKSTAEAAADRGAGVALTAPKRSGPRPPSVIAAGLTVEGDLKSEFEVMVDGVVCGDVTVRRLVVGVEGRVTGNIVADSADIYGEVRGNIAAAVVRLYKTGRVTGDLTQTELSIESGAVFEGRSLRVETGDGVLAELPAPKSARASGQTDLVSA